MKTITITGEDRHVDNLVKENRIRITRGHLTISEGESTKTPKTDTKKSKAPSKPKLPKPAKVVKPKVESKKVVEPETKAAPEADTKDVNP